MKKLNYFLSTPVKNGYSPVCTDKPTSKIVLGLGALTGEGLDLSQVKWVPESNEQTDKFPIEPGDFLVSRSNTLDRVGRAALYRGGLTNCSYPDLMMKFRVDEEKILPDFMELILQSASARKHFMRCASGTSSTMAKITKSVVESLNVPEFSLSQQRKIVKTTREWGNAIERTESLIAANEKQFEWLCTNLLSKRKKSFGFPEKSNPTAFGDIFSLFKKVNKSCADYEVLSVTKRGIVSQSEYFNKDVASKDKSKYLIVDKYTLVMSGLNFWMGAIDFQTIRDTGIVSPAYKTFEINEGQYSRGYLRFFIRSHYMTKILLDSSIQGASIVRRNLDMEWLSNSLIDLPNLEEQNEIANILSLAEKEIKGLKLLAEKYRSQKSGLMQKLLTNEWQVSVQHSPDAETNKETIA
jgi:type I restriction enzyme S subunit